MLDSYQITHAHLDLDNTKTKFSCGNWTESNVELRYLNLRMRQMKNGRVLISDNSGEIEWKWVCRAQARLKYEDINELGLMKIDSVCHSYNK